MKDNDTTYNGWTNYETWAVALWIDNDQYTQTYWQNAAKEAWDQADDKDPNPYLDRSANAQTLLADALKSEHDTDSEHPVFEAAQGSVYADLLNAALSEVNWHEIADSLLRDLAEQAETETDAYQTQRS